MSQSHDDQKTGYGTYLSLNNPEMCKRIIEFIADSNPRTLCKGLDLLSESKAWYIDESLIQKIPGPMIRVILKKFDVKAQMQSDSNGVVRVIPITFEDWKRHVMGQFQTDISRVISANHCLLSYLRALIHRCYADDSILNSR